MRNRFPVILVATILSGSLSGYFFGDQSVWGMSYGPGIYFGLATAALFAWLYRSSILKLGLWLGASVLSWYLALHLALKIGPPDGSIILAYFAAGLLGSLLLGLFFWLLIRRVNRERIYLTVATGGILAVVMFLILTGADSEPTASYMISFVIWQVGVGSALALEA